MCREILEIRTAREPWICECVDPFWSEGVGLMTHPSPPYTQDIATRHAGSLFGVTNAGASLGGMFATLLVGVILDRTGSWSLVFQSVALCNFASAATFALLATSETQFE